MIFSRIYLVFFLFLGIQSWADASQNERAYKFYKDAEDAFSDGQLTKAIRLAQSAIDLVQNDGAIIINKIARYRFSSHGRGLTPVRHYDGDRVEYKPNYLIKTAQEKVKARAERVKLKLKYDNPPQLVLETYLVDSDDDGIFYEDEYLEFQVLVKNEGDGVATGVSLIIDARDSVSDFYVRHNIGDIAPKHEVVYVKEFSLPRDYDEEELEVVFMADEIDGFAADIVKRNFDIQEWEAPRIAIEVSRTFEALKPGRVSKYELEAKNVGNTPIRNIALYTELETHGLVLVDEQWPDKIVRLAPGEQIPLTLYLKGDLDIGVTSQPAFSIYSKDLRSSKHDDADKKIDTFSLNIERAYRSQHSSEVYQYADSKLGLTEADKRPARISKNKIKHNHNYALIFGNRNYKNTTDTSVKYAIRDAELIGNIFENNMGISRSNIEQYHDATLGDFKAIIGENGKPGSFQRRVNSLSRGKADTVFVFYSGLGVPAINEKWAAYLMPVDATSNSIDVAGYQLNKFFRQLSLLQAKNIVVFLDSSFSGNIHDGNFSRGNKGKFLLEPAISINSNLSNLTVFSAVQPGGAKTLFDLLGNSLFSNFLAKGLSGKADENGDKRLSSDELYRYLDWKVSSVSSVLGQDQRTSVHASNDVHLVEYH